MDNEKSSSGTQSVHRALAALKLVAQEHVKGVRAADVAQRVGLNRSTAYRLLACLVDENFLHQDASTRRFHLGVASMELGYSVTSRSPLLDTYRGAAKQLARLSGDTVFVFAIQGDYTICVMREDSSLPVRVYTTDVGVVRPIGVGIGGLAILASLGDEQVSLQFDRHRAAFEAANLSEDDVRRAVVRTRRVGYSEGVNVLAPGVSAVGATILVNGQVRGAVAIGAVNARMRSERRAELGNLLITTINRTEANRVESSRIKGVRNSSRM